MMTLRDRILARADAEDRADFAAGTVNWQTGDLWREALARIDALESALDPTNPKAQRAAQARMNDECPPGRGITLRGAELAIHGLNDLANARIQKAAPRIGESGS